MKPIYQKLLNKKWRIDNLYKIRDKEGRLIKFHRNRTQKHLNVNLHTRNLILKSRQLGFTTEESIDSLDDVLFTPNIDVLLIAHNLEAGENIFNKKVSFAWEQLHPQMKELWDVDNKTSKTLKFNFGGKGFSSIAVDTTGRSGTYQRVHITEFADLCKKYPKKVVDIIEGTIPAVPTTARIDIESTSQGASGEFFEMFMNAWNRGEPTSPLEWKAHFYNWTWDDAELERIKEPTPFSKMEQQDKFERYTQLHQLNQVQITYYYQKWLSLNKNWNSLKREYPTTPTEAFEAAAEGTFYGEIIAAMEATGRIGIVPHDRVLKVHTVWDLGVGKNMVVGFYQRDITTNQLRKIDYLEGEGSEALPEMIVKVLKKPYIYGKHFGPHDLETTDIATGQTRIKTAANLGLRFNLVEDVSLEDGINAATLVLDKLIVDKENCKKWVLAMKSYGREWDEKRGMYKDEPYHNWASHGADEWRYAALAEKKMTNDSQILNRPFYDETIKIWRNE